MIVDDSFNYHSLSLTIMCAIKRPMIVHDSLSKSHNVLASLTATYAPTACDCNKYVEALNFVTKMAVFQPRRTAIATILVTVMQNEICEELLGRHKRKKRSTNMAGPRIAYQTTTPLLVACFFF